MIESHIYVMITCDNCGKVQDFEQYDETTIETAEGTAIVIAEEVGWQIKEQHLCPNCKNAKERNTEHMISAARMMQDAADTISHQELFPDYKMRQLQEMVDRFEASIDRFVQAVEKLEQVK